MLMVIDEAHPGQLKPSTSAYDTKVAGIVSGAGGIEPGMVLQQEGVIDGDPSLMSPELPLALQIG